MPTPKAASLVSADTPIEMPPEHRRYVSRGAFKLEGALDAFGIDPTGKRVLDVGASTGGFTQVLLERGAREVVALDVGYGQLDDLLRSDPRVVVMERTNIRYVTPEETGGRFPLIVGDVSFISLCTVAEALVGLAEPGADLVLLAKPQFEASRAEVARGGIVRDDTVRRRAVEKVIACLDGYDLGAVAASASALPGAGGNREVFLRCRAGRRAMPLEVPA